MKKYEFILSTRKYPKGTIIEAKPDSTITIQRLERGIIKPVAPKRVKKVVEPEELKDASSDE